MIPIVSNLEDIISDANQRQVDFLRERNEKLSQQNAEMLAMLKRCVDEYYNGSQDSVMIFLSEAEELIKEVEGK